jgi:hypothetical protein
MNNTPEFYGTDEQLLNALDFMTRRNNLTLTDKSVIRAAIDLINEKKEAIMDHEDYK